MIITKLKFGLTRNLGNYESTRVDIEADLESWEELEPSMQRLKLLVANQIGFESSVDFASLTAKDSALKAELSEIQKDLREKRLEVATLKKEVFSLDQEIQKLINFKELVETLKPQMEQVTKASDDFYAYMGSTAHNLASLEVIWSGIAPPQEGEPVGFSDSKDGDYDSSDKWEKRWRSDSEDVDPIPFENATADCGSNHLIDYGADYGEF